MPVGSVWAGSVWAGSMRVGCAWVGSVRVGFVQVGSGWVGSGRVGSGLRRVPRKHAGSARGPEGSLVGLEVQWSSSKCELAALSHPMRWAISIRPPTAWSADTHSRMRVLCSALTCSRTSCITGPSATLDARRGGVVGLCGPPLQMSAHVKSGRLRPTSQPKG